jgi:hypothetical protein
VNENDIRNNPDFNWFFKSAHVAALGCIAFAFIAPVYLFITIAM